MARMTKDERRGQILDLARQEFAEHGLAAASIDVVARRAGITSAYVFRLFGTKKALFLELLQESYSHLIAGLEEAATGRGGLSAVQLMAPAYLENLTDRTRLGLQLQGLAASSDPEVREVVRAQFGRLWNCVGAVTGMDPVGVKAFLGFGLFMSAAAAMDLDGVSEPWALGAATTVHGGLFEHITQSNNRPA